MLACSRETGETLVSVCSSHSAGVIMNQEKLAKLQAQVRIGGKVSGH